MTLKGYYAPCFKTRELRCCYLFIFSFTIIQSAFSRHLMTAGAVMVLIIRKLKQIAIKGHWAQEKHAASRGLLAIVRLSLFVSQNQ